MINIAEILFLYNGGICTSYDGDNHKVITFDEEED